MDTAVLKSWCEVVRRTDPLIWALAMEASQQQEHNIDSILLSPSSCSLSSSSPPSLQPSPVISASAAEGSDARVSTSSPLDAAAVARRKMFSSFRNSHCRSLLEPTASQSQNAMDWLKCLIQTSSSTTTNAQEDGQGHYLKQKSHKETAPIHCSPVVPRRSSINDMKVSRSGKETDQEEQAAISLRVTTGGTGGSEENAPSTGSTSSTSTSNSNTSGSAGSPSPSSPKLAANTHHTHRPGNTSKNHQNTYYATTFNWMYYASEPAAAPAPTASAIGRFGSRSNEDHAGSHSSKSPVTISPSIATAATAAVASHLAGEREAASAAVSSVVDLQGSSSADLSNSDTTVKNHSNNNMETATNANTNSTATSVHDKPNNNNSNINNTVKHSYRLENLFPFLSSTSATPITLQTTTAFLTRSFHTTTTATSAFFYRTFSPTYRICTLYRDSWTDGSQLRGLERIATSFWKLDGVVLMKRSVEQMKDVCGMVRDAYGLKAKTAKAKRAQEEREKLASEGRRRVEENIRAKEKERKNAVERKRGGEDDGHEGGDGSGGMGGGLD